MTKSLSCGVDFGTSNSAITVHSNDEVKIIEAEPGKVTIPSALFFVDRQPEIHFGRSAIQLFLAGKEGRFMRSLKRVLGTSVMKQGTLINGRLMKFDKIIGSFIQNLKEKAENTLQDDLEDVVMGRPVHFVDGDPEADHRAQAELHEIARNVGFKNIAFQFEPIAAAYAHEATLTSEKLALIADIGGGTSDFTVIRLSNKYLAKSDRTADILANSGIRIGGNDLDKALSLLSFMPAIGYGTTYGEKNLPVSVKPFQDLSEWSKVNFLYTNKIRMQIRQILAQSHDKERFKRVLAVIEEEKGHTLLQEVEQVKISLTQSQETHANLDFIANDLTIRVERKEFEHAIQDHLAHVSKTALECIRSAGLQPKAINLIVLTGGSTEIPLVQHEFKRLFPQAAISDENKLSSVATGLAYDSIRTFG